MFVLIIGIAFIAVGVLCCVNADFSTGVLSFLLGTTFVIHGLGTRFGPSSPASRVTTILNGIIFSLTSGVYLLLTMFVPGFVGVEHRIAGIAISAVGVAFFGLGSLALIVKECRRKRADQPAR